MLRAMPLTLSEAARTLAAHMRARGLKSTRQRDQILEAFLEAGGHVSIDELHVRVQSLMPGVGQATVYRTMKLLVEAGIAHERRFHDGQSRYEVVVGGEHHDHIICVTCGRIFEFEDPIIEARQAAVAAAHGLRVESHRHEIYGRCENPGTCPHRVD
jgi:Fur family ferric uptake transcriptional regulator